MTKEEFMAKLQMVYVGDKNAFNELVSVYSELQQKNIELNNINDKLSMALNSAEQRIDRANKLIKMQLLSNTNLTKYTDGDCLKDVQLILQDEGVK